MCYGHQRCSRRKFFGQATSLHKNAIEKRNDAAAHGATRSPDRQLQHIVKTGSTADPQGKEGLASLTAELLRKGTRTRTSEQVSSDLDFIGAEFAMNANTDFTAGSAEFLKKDIRQGMDLLDGYPPESSFPQDELTKLTEQRVDGIKSAKDRADSVIGRYFATYLYGKHPYARPVGGDENSLRAITRADVQSFYGANYVPANTILAGAGDFNAAEMRR